MKTTVAVFFGGRSVEHEVSIISGIQALTALDSSKYNPCLSIYQRTTCSTPESIWAISKAIKI